MPTNRRDSMTVPLMILAVCAAVVGFTFISSFDEFLRLAPSLAWKAIPAGEVNPATHSQVAITSTLVAVAGIGVAAFLYLEDRKLVDWLMARFAQCTNFPTANFSSIRFTIGSW